MTAADHTAEIAATLAKLAALIADQHRNEAEIPSPEPRTMPERTLLTVQEAADRLRIGRTKVYALVKSGEIESVRIGRLRRVPVSAIDDYAARLVAEQAAEKNAA
ncbi:helix-turn-helix domain-containing protein [Saccharopolyspora taberi]|uniref:Excisionase family DNA-binding protein n=1 Tax=Saccharopolyspora taberi TaxID=60895 RepID=A0ABN3VN26_9PSEU